MSPASVDIPVEIIAVSDTSNVIIIRLFDEHTSSHMRLELTLDPADVRVRQRAERAFAQRKQVYLRCQLMIYERDLL